METANPAYQPQLHLQVFIHIPLRGIMPAGCGGGNPVHVRIRRGERDELRRAHGLLWLVRAGALSSHRNTDAGRGAGRSPLPARPRSQGASLRPGPDTDRCCAGTDGRGRAAARGGRQGGRGSRVGATPGAWRPTRPALRLPAHLPLHLLAEESRVCGTGRVLAALAQRARR